MDECWWISNEQVEEDSGRQAARQREEYLSSCVGEVSACSGVPVEGGGQQWKGRSVDGMVVFARDGRINGGRPPLYLSSEQ